MEDTSRRQVTQHIQNRARRQAFPCDSSGSQAQMPRCRRPHDQANAKKNTRLARARTAGTRDRLVAHEPIPAVLTCRTVCCDTDLHKSRCLAKYKPLKTPVSMCSCFTKVHDAPKGQIAEGYTSPHVRTILLHVRVL